MSSLRFSAAYTALLLAAIANADEPVSRIVFGSCIKQDRPIPILFTMQKERPDLLLFIGDNIYADTEDSPPIKNSKRCVRHAPRWRRGTITITASTTAARTIQNVRKHKLSF